jgi:hypothetical protein
MAVWDLNSTLDVFGMQTFLTGLIYVRTFKNFPIGSNVKIMSADGGHFESRSGSLNTILEVDHLRTIDDMFAILAYWF